MRTPTLISSTLALVITAILLASLGGCASTGSGNGAADYPIVASTLDGDPYDIGARLDAGETVALVFWQTGCPHSKEAAPDLVAAAAENGERITFLGLVPGPARVIPSDSIRQKAAEWSIPYPTLRDADLALYNLFGVGGTPTIVVIDSDRTVRYRSSQLPRSWASL